jgi:hypothetical protein
MMLDVVWVENGGLKVLVIFITTLSIDLLINFIVMHSEELA